jgi:hypothetical protein
VDAGPRGYRSGTGAGAGLAHRLSSSQWDRNAGDELQFLFTIESQIFDKYLTQGTVAQL